MATHYAVLKVASDAPTEVIRAAYRVLAARHHPDRCTGHTDAVRRMQRVNEAWRVLSDDTLRAAYDRELGRRGRRASDRAPATATAPDGIAPTVVAGTRAVPTIALRRRAAAYAQFAAFGGPRQRSQP